MGPPRRSGPGSSAGRGLREDAGAGAARGGPAGRVGGEGPAPRPTAFAARLQALPRRGDTSARVISRARGLPVHRPGPTAAAKPKGGGGSPSASTGARLPSSFLNPGGVGLFAPRQLGPLRPPLSPGAPGRARGPALHMPNKRTQPRPAVRGGVLGTLTGRASPAQAPDARRGGPLPLGRQRLAAAARGCAEGREAGQAPPGQAGGADGGRLGSPAEGPEGPRVRRGRPAPRRPPPPAVPRAGTMGRRRERETGRRAPGFPEKERLKSPPQTVICT